jgi:hypothetical protein
MFPPRAESVDSFSLQPAIDRRESQTLTSDSPSPIEGLDLALLRFVNCLVRHGLTIQEADVVVSGELERVRASKPRPRLTLSASGGRLVPVAV